MLMPAAVCFAFRNHATEYFFVLCPDRLLGLGDQSIFGRGVAVLEHRDNVGFR